MEHRCKDCRWFSGGVTDRHRCEMRLIDADALKAIRFHDLPYSPIVPADCDTDEKVYAYKLGWNDAIDAIVEAAPTVDAVEVVRCKDCFHFWDGVCKAHIDVIYVDDNGFCSYGERREDG